MARKKSEPKGGGLKYAELAQIEANRTGGSLRQRALEIRRQRSQEADERASYEKQLQERNRDRPMLPIEKWIENPYYVGTMAAPPGKGGLYTPLRKLLIDVFEGDEATNGEPYFEILILGGIGSGKSTIARAIALRIVYELSCHQIPQHWLGNMMAEDSIVLMSFDTDEKKARDKLFAAFRRHVLSIPYFQEEFAPRKGPERWIDFPKNISWYPAGADPEKPQGFNLILSIVDETNFFPVQEGAKRRKDGKPFDAADELCKATRKRTINRFGRPDDTMPRVAKHIALSQSRYPDDYLERRRKFCEKGEAERPVKIIHLTEWEVRPPEEYRQQGWFYVASPPPGRRPEMYDATEPGTEAAEQWRSDREGEEYKVVKPPRKYLDSFREDIDDSLRTLAGIATESILPFVTDADSVQRMPANRATVISAAEMTVELQRHPLRHPMGLPYTTLQDSALLVPEWLSRPHPEKDKRVPLVLPGVKRFLHFDGALGRKDAAGIAVGCVFDRVEVTRIVGRGHDTGGPVKKKEMAPVIWIDLILQVKAPKDDEIDLGHLREIVYTLDAMGFRFGEITFDGWAGLAETRQVLTTRGYEVGLVSVDRDSGPYKLMRRAMKDGRLLCYSYQPLEHELKRLEYNAATDKIAHPPHGSKDCSDALAAVVHMCETRGMQDSTMASDDAIESVRIRTVKPQRRSLPSSHVQVYMDALNKGAKDRGEAEPFPATPAEVQRERQKRRKRVRERPGPPTEMNARTYRRPVISHKRRKRNA